MPDTTTATELQRNYKMVAERAKKTKEPIVVLSNNEPEAVYIDYDTYTQKLGQPASYAPKNSFDDIFGSITNEEYKQLEKALEDFEVVDYEDWQ
ncbi:MAG: type II toxin-antitoxin system Phd/YefM family antitoxin [Patescibacteria group bacterium]